MVRASDDPDQAARLEHVRTAPCSRCNREGCMVCEVLATPGIWPLDRPLPKIKREGDSTARSRAIAEAKI